MDFNVAVRRPHGQSIGLHRTDPDGSSRVINIAPGTLQGPAVAPKVYRKVPVIPIYVNRQK